ncbi:hypothetical protein PENSPDRAFT_123872 [Peniophora sp. CONT]|nr:hypothetical protein PENSPDRAFT_123872 [Peniophora sp. CONT]
MGALYSYLVWLTWTPTLNPPAQERDLGPPVEERGFNLNSTPYFPAVRELPCVLGISPKYFALNEERNLYVAKHHWLLLAEVIGDLTIRLSPQEKRKAKNYGLSAADLERPCYLVCDRNGTIFPLVFRLSDDDLRAFKHRLKGQFKEGRTVAVFYANWSPFLMGIAGVVVGRLRSIEVIYCPLRTLLWADRDSELAVVENACIECGFNVSVDVICDKCRQLGRYCTKRCRATYSPLHKKMCTASKQVKAWKALDWDKFDEAWSTEV